MTNGEMVQKVFNCEVCEPIIEDDVIHVIFADKKDSAIGFDWSWWNAEYKEPTTNNDLALIHTEGLDEEIRCTMCTNSMKSDRGCDGSCVANNAMYKKVMDVIESHIAELPSVTSQEPRKGKWIINKERTAVCCPFCKTKVRNCADEIKILGTAFSGLNFCQYCGADMREVEE